MEKEKDIFFDYEYDGIRELDNSFFFWWVVMFYVIIVFVGVYLIYYYVMDYGVD